MFIKIEFKLLLNLKKKQNNIFVLKKTVSSSLYETYTHKLISFYFKNKIFIFT